MVFVFMSPEGVQRITTIGASTRGVCFALPRPFRLSCSRSAYHGLTCHTSVGFSGGYPLVMRKEIIRYNGPGTWCALTGKPSQSKPTPANEGQNNDEDSAASATPLDGELRSLIEEGMRARATSDEELRESDENVLDGLADGGQRELQAIADDVYASLHEVSRSTTEQGQEILAAELQRTLEQFDKRSEKLMEIVVHERDFIRAEAERIQSLVYSLSNGADKGGAARNSTRENILFGIVVLFFTATLSYTWQAFTEQSSAALRSAVVDCVIAVIAVVFYNREKNKFTE